MLKVANAARCLLMLFFFVFVFLLFISARESNELDCFLSAGAPSRWRAEWHTRGASEKSRKITRLLWARSEVKDTFEQTQRHTETQCESQAGAPHSRSVSNNEQAVPARHSQAHTQESHLMRFIIVVNLIFASTCAIGLTTRTRVAVVVVFSLKLRHDEKVTRSLARSLSLILFDSGRFARQHHRLGHSTSLFGSDFLFTAKLGARPNRSSLANLTRTGRECFLRQSK